MHLIEIVPIHLSLVGDEITYWYAKYNDTYTIHTCLICEILWKVSRLIFNKIEIDLVLYVYLFLVCGSNLCILENCKRFSEQSFVIHCSKLIINLIN